MRLKKVSKFNSKLKIQQLRCFIIQPNIHWILTSVVILGESKSYLTPEIMSVNNWYDAVRWALTWTFCLYPINFLTTSYWLKVQLLTFSMTYGINMLMTVFNNIQHLALWHISFVELFNKVRTVGNYTFEHMDSSTLYCTLLIYVLNIVLLPRLSRLRNH